MRSSLIGSAADADHPIALADPRMARVALLDVLAACGTPTVLDAAHAPTYAGVQSAIAWSSSLSTRLVRTAGVRALIGRGSGEAVQLAFSGDGVVVIQASEGPRVAKHDHKGISEWLG